jgi:cysteine-rich repeat protein
MKVLLMTCLVLAGCGSDEKSDVARPVSDDSDVSDVSDVADTAVADLETSPDLTSDVSTDLAPDLSDDVDTDVNTDTEEPIESNCDDLTDDDFDGRTDCDDSDCEGDASCVGGDLALHAPCTSTSQCTGPTPVCLGEATAGHPGGECRRWCDPLEEGSCGADFFCLELGDRGQCVPRCSTSTSAPCRDAYRCAPFQIFEGGQIVDIGICVPGCRDDADCPVLGDCYDVPGLSQSGLCVAPEDCNTPGDEDADGRFDCEDDDCSALPSCDVAPLCAAPVSSLTVTDTEVVVLGDTTGATSLVAATCTGQAGGKERLYTVTAGLASQTGTLELQLGGGPDLGVYVREQCNDASTELGCADNASSEETEFTSFAVPGGVPLALFVDAIGDDVGAFELRLSFVPDVCGDGQVTGLEGCDDAQSPPLSGDGCSNTCQPELDVLCTAATPLAEGSSQGDPRTSDSQYFEGSCLLFGNQSKEDLWSFIAPTSGRATVRVLPDGDTADLAVYVRTSCEDTTTEVACADNTRVRGVETVSFGVDAGTRYYVFVDGMLSDFDLGPYRIELELP